MARGHGGWPGGELVGSGHTLRREGDERGAGGDRDELRGQGIGGIAQGVGYALDEEGKTEKGRILNPGLTD